MDGYRIRAISPKRLSYARRVSLSSLYESIYTSIPHPYCRAPVIRLPRGLIVKSGDCGVSTSVDKARSFVEEEKSDAHQKYHCTGD
jgi:hypothetical protein